MRIIDLLNKIANGETPPKIKFNNSIYEYHDKEHGYCRYYHDNTYICLDTDYYLFDILNDNVEIIEEENKIEKLKWNVKSQHNCTTDKTQATLTQLLSRTEQLKKSLNELIDEINKLKEDK